MFSYQTINRSERRRLNYLLVLVALIAFASCRKKDAASELSLSPSEALVPAAGGTIEVTVTSTTSWTVDNSSDWCSVVSLGNNGHKLVLGIQQNNDTSERTAIITVTAGSTVKEVKIRQSGNVITYSIPPDQTGMRNISSIDLAKEMKIGWNVGNSLEAIGGETAGGNPMITQRLIDAVKQAGFNAVRIPVAWSRFTDASSFKIDTNWMARVEEVVNYVLKDNMYAIVNIHWDGGWMQPTYAKQDYVNNRLAAMWRQIAVRFRNYDDHLLFAGTNEVMVEGDYNTPKTEYYTVQNSFNQTFVSTVRSTGGRNVYRNLIVQGFNTNITYTAGFNIFKMPLDVNQKKLMVEVHYYEPYDFTLNGNSTITQWGKTATDPSKTEKGGDQSYADEKFGEMKTKFVDNGYPVILGEYGAIARLNLGSSAANAEHAGYREYYIRYITRSAINNGLIPFYWDNGFTGDKGMGLFDRASGAVAYPEIINAITGK
jgi:endoglucanase